MSSPSATQSAQEAWLGPTTRARARIQDQARRNLTSVQLRETCSSVDSDNEAPAFVAATAVLNTTELLEAILVCLDFKTLLVSIQQVCHRFHDVVKDSIQLQKKLFLVPVDTFEEAKALHMVDDESMVLRGEEEYDEVEFAVVNKSLFTFDADINTDGDVYPLFLRHQIWASAEPASYGQGS